MAKFRPSTTANRWYARVPVSAFGAVGSAPDDFGRFCDLVGNDAEVSLSRAGRDSVKRVGREAQDEYIVRALPYALANAASRRRGGAYRVWSTDFALLQGARTEAEVIQGLKDNGITSDARDCGTLDLPPNPEPWRPKSLP